jgi:iron complex outermembrane recepter protein
MANRNIERAVRVALLAAGAASIGAYSSGAVAQTAVNAGEELEQVVVTGSRIARPEADTTSPMAVIGSESIALLGTQNIENVLNTMPQVVATTTSASNNPGGGVATVNLRGLGSQRTLVLVDGRRYVSYDVNQVVDLNTIPASLIERIDVVTGGRSAVYGSDAIAGVVNFVMKDHFQGVEFNTAWSETGRGDGMAYGGDVTVGGDFADGKGNAVLFASYYNRDGVLAGARGFSKYAVQDNCSPECGGVPDVSNGGSASVPGTRFTSPFAGISGSQLFESDGSFRPYVSGPDSYNYAPINYIQVPQERYLIYGKAQYEVNDWFQPYMEGQFIHNNVPVQLAATPIGNATTGVAQRGGLQVHTYSPYLSATSQAAFQALDAGAVSAANPVQNDGYVTLTGWGRRMAEMGPRINDDSRNAFRVLWGSEGQFGTNKDWNYDLFYQYSETQNSQGQDGNIAISKFLAATHTAFMNADGDVQAQPWVGEPGGGTLVCADAGARDSGCVPANIYGPQNVSGDAVNYMAIHATNLEKSSTQDAQLTFSNSNLADPWGAGPIGIAFGTEYRRETGTNTPDSFLSSGDVAGFNASDPTSGSYAVMEYFAEINVPIVKDLPGAQEIDFNGAYRYSDYSNNVGSVSTYAAGLTWTPIGGYMLRGQYQRAIRGPSVAELFLGQTDNFTAPPDPCMDSDAATPGPKRDLCIATGVPPALVGTDFSTGDSSVPATNGGNPELQEEDSDTWTAGIVIQPPQLPHLLATVDWWSIKIDNFISSGVGAQNIVTACYDYSQTFYCGLITRNANGNLQSFYDVNVNSASLETAGIDVQIGYNFDLGFGLPGTDASNLAFNFYGTWLDKYDYTPIVGLPLVNHCAGAFGLSCGAPNPDWRNTFSMRWASGPLTAQLLWRYMDSVKDDDPTQQFSVESIDSQSYFDLSGTWAFNDAVTMGVGIDNLLDEYPSVKIPSGQNFGNGEQSNTYPTVYDLMGRTYWATLKVKF